MGYPKELDEYSDEEIAEEHRRRQRCREQGICFYCRRPLDSGKACKIQSHQPRQEET